MSFSIKEENKICVIDEGESVIVSYYNPKTHRAEFYEIIANAIDETQSSKEKPKTHEAHKTQAHKTQIVDFYTGNTSTIFQKPTKLDKIKSKFAEISAKIFPSTKEISSHYSIRKLKEEHTSKILESGNVILNINNGGCAIATYNRSNQELKYGLFIDSPEFEKDENSSQDKNSSQDQHCPLSLNKIPFLNDYINKYGYFYLFELNGAIQGDIKKFYRNKLKNPTFYRDANPTYEELKVFADEYKLNLTILSPYNFGQAKGDKIVPATREKLTEIRGRKVRPSAQMRWQKVLKEYGIKEKSPEYDKWAEEFCANAGKNKEGISPRGDISRNPQDANLAVEHAYFVPTQASTSIPSAQNISCAQNQASNKSRISCAQNQANLTDDSRTRNPVIDTNQVNASSIKTAGGTPISETKMGSEALGIVEKLKNYCNQGSQTLPTQIDTTTYLQRSEAIAKNNADPTSYFIPRAIQRVIQEDTPPQDKT